MILTIKEIPTKTSAGIGIDERGKIYHFLNEQWIICGDCN